MPLHVLILAAGEGKRLRSAQPKLLHFCSGLPLIVHTVRAACELDADSVHVVDFPSKEMVVVVHLLLSAVCHLLKLDVELA